MSNEKLITTLKPEWKAQIPAWNQETIRIIMSCEELDRSAIVETVKALYKVANLAEPQVVTFVPSPLVLILASGISIGMYEAQKEGKAAYKGKQSPVQQAVRRALKVVNEADTWIIDEEQTYEHVMQAVREATQNMPAPAVDAKFLLSHFNTAWSEYFGACEWASWPRHLAFYRDVCGLKLKEHEAFKPYDDLSRLAGPTVLRPEFVMVSEKPQEMHTYTDAEGRHILHCTTGPAIKRRGGSELYYLNGVRMRREHVMTPGEEMDAREVLKEQNVEVRRELIRKIGISSLLAHLDCKVLDRDGEYELLSVKLSEQVQDARYLRMRNPSIGIWHLEGVEGNTVQEAVNWRAGGREWHPEELT